VLKTFSGRAASQHPDELGPFTDLLVAHGVRSYLEIGARHGDTFHHVMSALPVGSVGIAVDLPGGAWGQAKSQPALLRAVKDLTARGYRCAAVFGDSTSPEVFTAVAQALDRLAVNHESPRGFDAALIDGDHRYAGVSRDYRIWGPCAPITAFHDVAGEGVRQKTTGDPVEVPRLWREIKADPGGPCEIREFIGEGSAMGIGVIIRPVPGPAS